MLATVNLESEAPIYVQVKNQVLFAIADGRLKPGDALPTVNRVAESTGVNMNTIGKAYRDLEVMGLVKARRGRGFFVLQAAPDLCRERVLPDIINRLHSRVGEARAAGLDPEDIMEVVRISLESDAKPYEAPPAALLRASKSMLKKKD